MGRAKIETTMARISVKNNPESLRFDSEKDFIAMCIRNIMDDYLRFKEPEINKTAVKAALKSGIEIPGAALERKQSLVIK